jgi:hypothetical protein
VTDPTDAKTAGWVRFTLEDEYLEMFKRGSRLQHCFKGRIRMGVQTVVWGALYLEAQSNGTCHDIISVLLIPITLLLAFPLDWMFPLKRRE